MQRSSFQASTQSLLREYRRHPPRYSGRTQHLQVTGWCPTSGSYLWLELTETKLASVCHMTQQELNKCLVSFESRCTATFRAFAAMPRFEFGITSCNEWRGVWCFCCRECPDYLGQALAQQRTTLSFVSRLGVTFTPFAIKHARMRAIFRESSRPPALLLLLPWPCNELASFYKRSNDSAHDLNWINVMHWM